MSNVNVGIQFNKSGAFNVCPIKFHLKIFAINAFFILLFWLPGIFDKFILFSSSGNVTFI